MENNLNEDNLAEIRRIQALHDERENISDDQKIDFNTNNKLNIPIALSDEDLNKDEAEVMNAAVEEYNDTPEDQREKIVTPGVFKLSPEALAAKKKLLGH